MKLAAIGTILATLALGCGSTSRAPTAPTRLAACAAPGCGADAAYRTRLRMQQLEAQARLHNVTIIWVHPPGTD